MLNRLTPMNGSERHPSICKAKTALQVYKQCTYHLLPAHAWSSWGCANRHGATLLLQAFFTCHPHPLLCAPCALTSQRVLQHGPIVDNSANFSFGVQLPQIPAAQLTAVSLITGQHNKVRKGASSTSRVAPDVSVLAWGTLEPGLLSENKR